MMRGFQRRIASLLLVFFIPTPVFAQEECVGFDDDALRLSCYDRAFGRQELVESQSSNPKENLSVTTNADIPPALLDALSNKSAVDLINAVKTADDLDGLQDEVRSEVIDIILGYVRPLPASNSEANRDGYFALAALDPSNPTYAQKADRYAAAVEEKRTSILRRMKNRPTTLTATFFMNTQTPRAIPILAPTWLFMPYKTGIECGSECG